MPNILSNVASGIKTFFSPYLRVALILAFLGLAGFGAYYYARSNKLEKQAVVAQFRDSLATNNLRVMQDSAVHWTTKDSLSAVSRGLLAADNTTMKQRYDSLEQRFNDLVPKGTPGVTDQTYLQEQLALKDSIIASITSHTAAKDSSYVANDSTLIIHRENRYDANDYHILNGTVALHLRNNAVSAANLNLSDKFGVGVEVATYHDAQGMPHVTVASKYPGLDLNVSGIQNVESELRAKEDAANVNRKSPFGVVFTVGYGGIIGSNTTLQKGIFAGVGVAWMPNFLRFNK